MFPEQLTYLNVPVLELEISVVLMLYQIDTQYL